MNKSVHWAIALLTLHLTVAATQAQTVNALAKDDYFVCRIVAEVAPGESHSLTGFKVKGVDGIYTALHGVAQAKTISAFFHDPDTRQVKMTLSKVDIARDVALLVTADGRAEIPRGGLALGFWPRTADAIAELSGSDVTVIGHPLDIERIPTHTPLKLRPNRCYEELSDIVNVEARGELNARNSPTTSTFVLALEGNFLPGHSGAPIMDRDGAVIGIGNGGLRDGQVGYGWAIPFHEVELQPLTNESLAEIAKLPSFLRAKHLFLISVAGDRDQARLLSEVTTVVESDDGSPVLGLKNLPDNELKNEIDRLKVIIDAIKKGENDKFSPQGEFARIMSRRVYLPSGTPVTLLEDPTKLAAPLQVPGQSPANGNAATPEFQFAIGYLFSKVRVGEGGNQPMDLYVPSNAIRRRSSTVINAPNNQGVIIGGDNKGMVAGRDIVVNQSPKLVRKMILNNDGGATLILRENIGELTDAIGDPNQHLGIAVHGTEVKLLDGKKNFGPIIEFRKIEILSGEFKGKRGWVSKNVISEINAPESEQ